MRSLREFLDESMDIFKGNGLRISEGIRERIPRGIYKRILEGFSQIIYGKITMESHVIFFLNLSSTFLKESLETFFMNSWKNISRNPFKFYWGNFWRNAWKSFQRFFLFFCQHTSEKIPEEISEGFFKGIPGDISQWTNTSLFVIYCLTEREDQVANGWSDPIFIECTYGRTGKYVEG